jgi:hypothetical protein
MGSFGCNLLRQAPHNRTKDATFDTVGTQLKLSLGRAMDAAPRRDL